MNQPKPIQLEFMDCKGCGKRVATTAKLCRHCNSIVRSPQRLPVIQPNSASQQSVDDDDSEDDSHAALALGGYDDNGMSEEDETSASKKSIERIYWITAVVLLLIFCLAALAPLLRL